MKRTFTAGAAALAVAVTLLGVAAGAPSANEQAEAAARPPACARPNPDQPPPAPGPTTATTVGQAYYCILDNYYSGPVLDSRDLLVPAFAALTQELQRRGLDQPHATLPALTGRKDADWAAFAKLYRRIADALPDDDARKAIGHAAIKAMVGSLHDNHARFLSGFVANLYGLDLSPIVGPGDIDPVSAEPAYVLRLNPGGPAEKAGVKLGDEVVAINGAPLYSNGVLNEGVLKSLSAGGPGSSAEFTVRRPATGETLTLTATAAQSPPSRPGVTSRLVDGTIAYVSLPGFAPDLADQVLAAIAELRKTAQLRGVVLDLRGNGGGSPQAVSKLLGALAHGKITSYWCDVKGNCTPNRTDDSVELLNLPFVALTDRRCASACDSFSSAVKDLKLGTLVGTRTAGAVSGPGEPFALDNGTALMLPRFHEIAANKEIVDTIGVAPDHYAPLTAADLSAGRDPGLDKAVSLL
ncbi:MULTISPECIES: S41 family peptidase [unclassified Saccharothrix]|uniref:S41 family peptidase n=1 Tax=unclassified Saccharothrix TaxID=2593673 RepID=UPI00307D8D97